MTATGQPVTTPPSSEPPQIKTPVMALRTYRFLRLSAVAVIAVLAASLIKEYIRGPDCLNGSISAYYFTPVQSVFVGALCALGLVMIALWGKTTPEDCFFNLAGMLAPVVAFVPTNHPTTCGLVDEAGDPLKSDAERQSLVEASHLPVLNNMAAYLIVVFLMLVALLVAGIVAKKKNPSESATKHPLSYWVPWGGACALWAILTGEVLWKTEWLFKHTHKPAAIIMFVFIVAAIYFVGRDKSKGNRDYGEEPSPGWARTYWTLVALMVAGALVIVILGWGRTHQAFVLEAWMISLLAVFWALQTWDRWSDGAPPLTDKEKADRQELLQSLAE